MRFFKKPLMLVLAALMLLLAACGGESQTPAGSSSAAPAASSAAPAPQASAASAAPAEPAQSEGFNAAGFPIVTEQVTKRFMLRKPPHIGDPAQMVTFQKYEEMTNVKIEWDAVSSDGFNERVNLVMASNDMPDAILKGTPDITKASADGAIIDLTDLIGQYAPGLSALYEQNPAAKAAAKSPDGGMYSIPSVNTLTPNRTAHRNLWINQKWLDTLGLSIPTTTDEFLDVLRAFRDGDPNSNGQNDEIPMVVEYAGGDHSLRAENMMSFWGMYPNLGYGYMQVVDGKASMLVATDTYREVLQYMKTLWEEKLIDNAIFTQTGDVALSKFNSDIAGCFGLSSDDLWSKYSEDYSPLPPVQAPGGKQPVIGLGSPYGGASMVVTKADQTPEITIRWIDYFFTEEGSMFIGGFAPSLEGITGVIQPDGHYEYTEAMLGDERGISVALGEACPLPGGGFPYWRNENNSNYIYSETVKKSVPVYEPYYQKDEAYAYPVFDLATAEKVSDIRRDLDIYIRECQAKFVTGEMSFDQWDEYLKTLDQMRVTELEGYFQAALDNM